MKLAETQQGEVRSLSVHASAAAGSSPRMAIPALVISETPEIESVGNDEQTHHEIEAMLHDGPKPPFTDEHTEFGDAIDAVFSGTIHDGGGGDAAPDAATAEEDCPHGWSAHDHPDGRYYSNDHTRETTYDKPVLPAPPEGWSVHKSRSGKHGTHFWQHDAGDGETQWHHPFDDLEMTRRRSES